MKKDFGSRFKPNVKFKVPVDIQKEYDLFLLLRGLDYSKIIDTFYTSECGNYIFPLTIRAEHLHIATVHYFEAIPELVPDGMRYNKELNKLVPDVIEDCFNSDFVQESADTLNRSAIYLKKEIINKRENGFIKADLQKLDFSLVDPFAYSDLAFQLTVGAKKYSKDNWKKGDINIYLSALERHIQAIKIALDNDDIEKLIDDTGVQHGGALLCNSMFIHYFIRQILKDKNAK